LKPVGNGYPNVTAINWFPPLEWKTEEGISSGYREKDSSLVNFWPYWVGMTDGQRVVYFGISGSF
jgi:hypothetical protein